jgi:PKD repeat protein
MNTGNSSINSMGRLITLTVFVLFSSLASAQFWSEDFNVGFCANTERADTATTANGDYLVSYIQASADTTHAWFISSREAFNGVGSCGASCLTNATLIDKTLHLSTTDAAGDNGAVYNNDSAVSVLAYTPAINCFGKFDLRIEFDYLMGGDSIADKAYFVMTNDSSTSPFNALQNPVYSEELPSTIGSCATSAVWTHKVIYLPATYSNQLSWYLGFRFDSDGNSAGSDVSLAIDNIQVFETLPLTSFTQTADTICNGNCVVVADSSQGNPTSWSWDFGPSATPTTATGAGPHSVCYSTNGTKTLQLTTTNVNGTTNTSENLLVVTCQPPVPAFIVSDDTLCQGQCINFTNTSTDGTFGQGQWTWQFQGGTPNVSTSESPANICYTNTGLYNITLTVVDTVSGETSTVVFPDAIEVGTCSVPTASFESDTTIICNNDFIEFYSTSTGIPDSISWYFEGGNPTITNDTSYADLDTIQVYYPTPGTFTVAIVVWNSGGTVSDTVSIMLP